MQKKNKSKFSLIKVIGICLILILLSGVGVMAVTTKVNTVKIELSNGYEMTVLTSKTNVKEILDDNNIILESNERVTPNIDEEISSNKTIKISDKSKQEIEVAKVSESGIEMTLDSLLEAYTTITEKIVEIEETIPYETITKDVSEGSSSTQNKVLQQGVEGKKKVTYKIKYQNDIEIEKNKISEEIVQEPVNKIIQVKSKTTSSRSSSKTRGTNTEDTASSTTSSSTVKIYKVTAYCHCSKCCGSYANGYTSSGTKASAGRTVAAPSNLPFGTKLNINGKTYVVEDRGGAIKGNRIDVYVGSHSEALAWGVRYLPVEVIN
jgi:3D (Asp-Asp-Asp) domain-containing protein